MIAFWSEEYRFVETNIVVVDMQGYEEVGVVIGRAREEDEDTGRLTPFYLVDLGSQGNFWFEDHELKLL